MWDSEKLRSGYAEVHLQQIRNGFYPFLIPPGAQADEHLPALSGFSLVLFFFAQWLEGRTRHEDLREHVIQHKTLKPRVLHLL